MKHLSKHHASSQFESLSLNSFTLLTAVCVCSSVYSVCSHFQLKRLATRFTLIIADPHAVVTLLHWNDRCCPLAKLHQFNCALLREPFQFRFHLFLQCKGDWAYLVKKGCRFRVDVNRSFHSLHCSQVWILVEDCLQRMLRLDRENLLPI